MRSAVGPVLGGARRRRVRRAGPRSRAVRAPRPRRPGTRRRGRPAGSPSACAAASSSALGLGRVAGRRGLQRRWPGRTARPWRAGVLRSSSSASRKPAAEPRRRRPRRPWRRAARRRGGRATCAPARSARRSSPAAGGSGADSSAQRIASPGACFSRSWTSGDVAQALGHLLVVHVQEAVVQPVAGVARPPLAGAARPGPSRSRGAGRSGRCRRRGCRSAGRGSARSSPSTRCASRAGPAPQGLSHSGSPGLDGFHSTKSAGWRL